MTTPTRQAQASYELKKAQATDRTRMLSFVGRDISPLPHIKNPQRRLQCKNDLTKFCTSYLSDWFSKPFGTIHQKLIAGLESCILDDGRLAISAPRGTGKTTLVIASIIWSLVYGHKKFIIALSANIKESKKVIETVLNTLSRTGPIYDDFPEVSYPLYKLKGTAHQSKGQHYRGEPTSTNISTEKLTLPTIAGSQASGSTIIALGIKSALRGQSIEIDGKICRPDFLLLDDIQTDDVALSPTRIAALEEKIASTIKGLAESGKELSQVFTCTVKEIGDLPDRILDHSIYPSWNGIRGQALESMPSNMSLWEEYRDIRFLNQQSAREFYKDNKEAMSEGAVVSWPENYDARHFEDALEYEMSQWSENERAFYSERQNTPMRPSTGAICVPADVICQKLNGLKHLEPPFDTYKITAFVDVHDDILYYSVTAWTAKFNGYVIDYGTFPEQSRPFFKKGESGLVTLKSEFGGSADSNLSIGLKSLLTDLLNTTYSSKTDRGQTNFRIDRILVDARYKSEVVEDAIRFVGSRSIIPTRGTGIKSTNKPMSQWPKRTGRVFGWHLIEELLVNHSFRSLLVDTNYWKSKLHEKLALNPADEGSISLYGKQPNTHRMLSEHLNAELVQLVSAGENTVNEWSEKPTRPDNHLFDCMVGTLVGASTLGLRLEDQPRL